MKNLLTKLRYVPKHFGVIAALVVAGTSAALALAWGPDRPTFTVEQPATHVTFNSITNNPIDGDERNFVRIKDTSTNTWTDDVVVQPGKEYKVRMVVHNNAADNLNLKAVNTVVKAAVPTTTGKSIDISGFVSADNAQPREVWDEVHLTSTQDFNLAYVAGSARIYNNGYAANGGASLPDSIVTSAGAKMGYAAAGDGIIPGCFKYLSYVEFTVKPQFAPTTTSDFTVAKTVSKHDAFAWGETYAAQPGELVDFRIKYSNTGSTQQDNVIVKDTLPAGLSYVAGTTKLYNSVNPNGKALSDNVTTNGVNIGSHAAGASSFVVFTAKVVANDQLTVCGPNTLKNVAHVTVGSTTKDDDANVTVTKTCVPEDKDIKVCRLSDKVIVTIKESAFDSTKYSKNLDDCKPVVVKDIQVCRLSDKTIITIKENEFDATKHSKNLDDCKPVVVPMIKVCELATYKVIEIKESDFNTSKHSKNLADCEKIQVCELATDTIITIRKTEFDATKHSTKVSDCDKIKVCVIKTGKVETIKRSDYDNNVHSTNMADCKDVNVCRISDHTVVTIRESAFDSTKYTYDVANCKAPVTPVTPVTPTTIASTGPEMLVGGLFGSSALGLGISSFVRSRSAVRRALRNL